MYCQADNASKLDDSLLLPWTVVIRTDGNSPGCLFVYLTNPDEAAPRVPTPDSDKLKELLEVWKQKAKHSSPKILTQGPSLRCNEKPRGC
jgi:hypothetical protein